VRTLEPFQEGGTVGMPERIGRNRCAAPGAATASVLIMARFFIRVVVFIVSATLGLWITSLLIDGFQINASGFVTSVLVFAVLQSVLSPFFAKVAHRYARALLGGVGLISTFVALLVAHFFTNGLQITGLTSWVAATVVVWLVTALATWLLPFLFVQKKVNEKRAA
jgi:uncharacterized membrane protein YvlD (DUF360 family)